MEWIRTGFEFAFSNYKRVTAALFVAVILLAIPITVNFIGQRQDIRQRAATSTEFGFNTHLSAANNNLDLNKFKSNIDELVANGQRWIRVNIIDFEVANPLSNPTSSNKIEWNTANLAAYDQAIDYAISHGIKVFLVTNTPSFAANYPLSDYQALTAEYHSFLANRYRGKIAVWNVFNEADVHNYTDYGPVTLSPTYLSNFNSVLASARSAIKTQDQGILITTNAGGYPLNDTLIANWYQFFDAIKDNLDIISVDMYPAPNMDEVVKLNTRIEEISSRYSKDVAVAEIGLCTTTPTYTEEGQQNYMVQSINNLKLSSAKIVLLYEIMDENTLSNTCEGTFGIIRTDGIKKSSFAPIMAAMQPPLVPTNIPTQTPTPTTAASPTPTVEPSSTPTPSPITKPTVTTLFREIGPDGNNSTQNVDVCGADLGSMFDWNGKTYITYGDTFGCPLNPNQPNWRSNTLAYSTDTNPADGIHFDGWITDSNGKAKENIPNDIVLGHPNETAITTHGVSVGNTGYLYYFDGDITTGWSCEYSSVAKSTDGGQNWTKLTNLKWNPGNFNQVAIYKKDGYVYFFGIPCARAGGVKMMRVAEGLIENKSAYEYLTAVNNGSPAWNKDAERSAIYITPAPVGELSIRWNAYLGKYMMMYLHDDPPFYAHGVELRTADNLWGPWSDPQEITTGPEIPCQYAPFTKEGYDENNGQIVYFRLSRFCDGFNPYSSFWMRMTFKQIYASPSPSPSPQNCPFQNRGDANCDRKVNTDDFNIWRDEFLHVVSNKSSDFNNDQTVNTDDFNIWRDGFLNESLPH